MNSISKFNIFNNTAPENTTQSDEDEYWFGRANAAATNHIKICEDCPLPHIVLRDGKCFDCLGDGS